MPQEKYVFTKKDKKEAREMANTLDLLLRERPIEGFSYSTTQTGREIRIKRQCADELVFKYKPKKKY